MLQRVLRFSAAIGIAVSGAACNGGAAAPPSLGSTGIAAPAAAQRAALQSALLAAQFAPLSTGGTLQVLGRRRTLATGIPLQLLCKNGASETDTYPDAQTMQFDRWLYYDAGCALSRKHVTGTVVATLGPKSTDSETATAVAYDRTGAATDYQTIGYYFDGPGGPDAKLQISDARAAGGAPFSSATMQCYYPPGSGPMICPVAAAVAGRGFDTGAQLAMTHPPTGPVQVQVTPFVGTPGSLSLAPFTFLQPPAVAGGTPLTPLIGTVSVTFDSTSGSMPVSAFTLTLSGGGEQITGSLANGVMTLQDGSATITVDVNGDGAVQYANGFVEQVIGYRDVG